MSHSYFPLHLVINAPVDLITYSRVVLGGDRPTRYTYLRPYITQLVSKSSVEVFSLHLKINIVLDISTVSILPYLPKHTIVNKSF